MAFWVDLYNISNANSQIETIESHLEALTKPQLEAKETGLTFS
jgi:hypothetical protein